jgi:D-alanyl-D-alanine carboxypeptidase/D-alanyl-D-alanine-endopeptidase (penicillin-binding protein 4)
VIEGDLYMVGGGDPGLVPEDFFVMARELRRKGVTLINGDLVGDDTLFDAPGRPAGWPRRNHHRAFSAPISALTASHSAAFIEVQPTHSGGPVEVSVAPFPEAVEVQVMAKTSSKGHSIRIKREVLDGRVVFRILGLLPAGSPPMEVVRSVERPTLYALEGMRSVLESQGIQLAGGVRRGSAPAGAQELVTHRSRPLHLLVRDMNKFSSNVMAEMLLKGMGAEVYGAPGTTEKGARAVLDWLAERGIATEGLQIRDGSGLTEQSRVTPDALVAALSAIYQDFTLAPEFISTLPVGGVDGTLKKRLGSVERRVRAKTGYIRSTIALSGYAQGQNGSRYAFSLLVTGSRCPEWKVQKSVDTTVATIVNGR